MARCPKSTSLTCYIGEALYEKNNPILTLESTLMTTFGDGTMSLMGRRIMLGVTGSLISLFVIVLAVYMIVQGTKKIRLIEKTKE